MLQCKPRRRQRLEATALHLMILKQPPSELTMRILRLFFPTTDVHRFIRSQELLEADAREALPYVRSRFPHRDSTCI